MICTASANVIEKQMPRDVRWRRTGLSPEISGSRVWNDRPRAHTLPFLTVLGCSRPLLWHFRFPKPQRGGIVMLIGKDVREKVEEIIRQEAGKTWRPNPKIHWPVISGLDIGLEIEFPDRIIGLVLNRALIENCPTDPESERKVRFLVADALTRMRAHS